MSLDFPWQAVIEAQQREKQNKQQMMQQFGGTIASLGQSAGDALQKRAQAKKEEDQKKKQQLAATQFGDVLSGLNQPAQGPETQAGVPPQRPPIDYGKLYASANAAFPGQAAEIMPAILKEFGTGQDSKYENQQDKLEKEYRDQLNKIVQARSGGLGLQDSKVNQAIDLRTLINQTYDPKTGKYNIPPSLNSELVLGLARMVSPSGQVGIELEQELKQKTLREGVASALVYLGVADPKSVGGPTQDVAKLFIDSIDRQGKTAEKLRDTYTKGLKDRYPTRLDPKRREFLEKSELGSSFDDFLKNSPDYKVNQEKKSLPAGFGSKKPGASPALGKATLRWNPQTGELEPVQ